MKGVPFQKLFLNQVAPFFVCFLGLFLILVWYYHF